MSFRWIVIGMLAIVTLSLGYTNLKNKNIILSQTHQIKNITQINADLGSQIEGCTNELRKTLESNKLDYYIDNTDLDSILNRMRKNGTAID